MRSFFALLGLILTGAAPALASDSASTISMTEKPAIVATLEKATENLQMPSETDAPFRVVFYALDTEELSPAEIAELAGAPEDAEIETRNVDEFFEAVATEEEWMNDEERAVAKRFAALLETLVSELKDVQVVLWGENELQVAIIGKCDGGFAGLLTIVVET
jgi:hypothetical protein